MLELILDLRGDPKFAEYTKEMRKKQKANTNPHKCEIPIGDIWMKWLGKNFEAWTKQLKEKRCLTDGKCLLILLYNNHDFFTKHTPDRVKDKIKHSTNHVKHYSNKNNWGPQTHNTSIKSSEMGRLEMVKQFNHCPYCGKIMLPKPKRWRARRGDIYWAVIFRHQEGRWLPEAITESNGECDRRAHAQGRYCKTRAEAQARAAELNKLMGFDTGEDEE